MSSASVGGAFSRMGVPSSSVGMSSSSMGLSSSRVAMPPSRVAVSSSSGGVAPSSVGGLSSSSVEVPSSRVEVSASRVAMVASSDKDASSGEVGLKSRERIANRKFISEEHAGAASGTSRRPKRPRPEKKRPRPENKKPRPEKKRSTQSQARTMLADSKQELQKWNAVLVKRKQSKRKVGGVKINKPHLYPAVICDIQGRNHVKVLFDDGHASRVVKRSNVRLMPNEEHPEGIAPHLRVNEVIEALDRNSGEWLRAKLERAVQALGQGSSDGLRLWVVYLEDGNGDWLRLHEVRPDSLDWQFEGHPFIGQRVARTFNGEVVYGTITKWLPADEANEEPAIYHMRHDDSDSEDLSQEEVIEARSLFSALQSQESQQNGEGAPPCSEEGGAPSGARALTTCSMKTDEMVAKSQQS
ncbi:hypothetical protein AB1Y20_010990 [Prymnesium parvum]|uniref:Tudor domain-containing protein n=1 Tax=Prymnesium parvum TaxID=97485 RepID=A0AB34INN5_PRYPA